MFLASALPGVLVAQAPLLDHQLASAAWLDAQIPTLTAGGPSAVLILNPGMRLALTHGGTIDVVAELPFVSATPPFDPLTTSSSSTLTGNPYIGLRFTHVDRWIDIGGRLPIARPDAASRGYPDSAAIFGDFDRHEAYIPDMASASFGITQTTFGARGFGSRVGLSALIDVPVRSKSNEHVDLDANLYALFGYLAPRFAILGGVTVNALLNRKVSIYGEAVSEQALLGIIFRTPYVRPSFSIRLPLSSNLSNLTKYVLQAGVVVGKP
ncbi:MAG TPA: hypothetical protein VGI92_00925 [Gemmatimonadales bacterium]